jgi:uncharacterized membrane protein
MIYLTSTLFALFLLVFTPIWAIICLTVFPFMRSETRYRFVSGYVAFAMKFGVWNTCWERLTNPSSF